MAEREVDKLRRRAERAVALEGEDPEDLSSADVATLVHLTETVKRVAASGETVVLEYSAPLADVEVTFQLVLAPMAMGDGDATGVGVVGRDLTELKRLATARQLLLSRLTAAQEEERQRIARDLHDGMGQQFTALSVGLKWAEQQCEEETELSAELRGLRALTQETMRHAHDLAVELRPVAVGTKDLDSLLRDYAHRWSETHRTPVAVHGTDETPPALSPATLTTVFRVVQEALTNVAKHAAAQQVNLTVDHHPDCVVVTVEDDGVGFDPRTPPRPDDPETSLGIVGMQERAAMVEGSVEIDSAPGRGTTVSLRVPFGSCP